MLSIETMSAGRQRWHTVHQGYDDQTQAMNTPGGVVMRTTECSNGVTAMTSVVLPGITVAQRWTAEVREADPDEGIEACILLTREVALVDTKDLGPQRRVLVVHLSDDRFDGTSLEGPGYLVEDVRHRLHGNLSGIRLTVDDAMRLVKRSAPKGTVDAVRIECTAGSVRQTLEHEFSAPSVSVWLSADEDLPRPSDEQIRAMEDEGR